MVNTYSSCQLMIHMRTSRYLLSLLSGVNRSGKRMRENWQNCSVEFTGCCFGFSRFGFLLVATESENCYYDN